MAEGTTKPADRVIEHVAVQARRPSPVPREPLAQDSEPDDTLGGADSRVRARPRVRSALVRSPRWTAVVAVLVLVLLGLVTTGTLLLLDNSTLRSRAGDTADATAAARQEILALTSVGAETAQQDIDRLIRCATGDFKNQFTQQQGTFRKVLKLGAVKSQGQIQDAGVVSQDNGTVVVLIAANATVENSQNPKGEQRQYRMKATMIKRDGQWLMSKLGFVP